MENQDIAANYRDENSQLVMISQSLSLCGVQIPLYNFYLWGAHIHGLIYESYSRCSTICNSHGFHPFLPELEHAA